MGKPTTNTDGKNADHQAKVLQTKGFSKGGAKDLVQGKAPKDPVDKARGKAPMDPETQRKIQEMTNETFVNRVKSSDKAQKAALEFIKG